MKSLKVKRDKGFSMKIMINHLGPIIKAEIDLKPLTIFVGPNNMGKTWLAYSIANIFSPYNFESYVKEYLSKDEEDSLPEIYPLLEEAIRQISNNGMTTIDMVLFATQYAEIYFNNMARMLKRNMPQFMATELASFKDLDISIDLGDMKQKILEQVLAAPVRTEISGSQKKPLSIKKKSGSRNLLAYATIEYASDKQAGEDILLPLDAIQETLTRAVLRLLHRSLYPQVRILPTERTTFITFPFIKRGKEDVDDLPSQIQRLEAKEMHTTMIGSTSFFLAMMIQTIQTTEKDINIREKDALRNVKIKRYIQLAELLEKEILCGEIIISQKELNPSQQVSQFHQNIEQKVLFKPTQDSPLEISLSSSMVKELSPLVLYLRYAAKPGELIVIDEPEMNLHPEAQTKMIEFLAMLVNADLNVLITTHSPYLIDHLANLIKATEIEDKESIRPKFYLQQTEAFLSKSKVSVHLFNQGYVTEAIDEEGGIDLSTFGDVSDRISDIYFEL